MLVLSHHEQEGATIFLPDGRKIRVVITSIRGNKVRVGYEAPSDLRISRDDNEQKDSVSRT